MSGKKSNATGKYCSLLTRRDVITAATDESPVNLFGVSKPVSFPLFLSHLYPSSLLILWSFPPSFLAFHSRPSSFLPILASPRYLLLSPSVPLSILHLPSSFRPSPALPCLHPHPSLSLPFLSPSLCLCRRRRKSGVQRVSHVFRHVGIALRRQLIFTTLQVIHSSSCIFVWSEDAFFFSFLFLS